MKSVFQSKKVIIIFGIAIFLVVGIILSISTIGSGNQISLQNKLELGKKYLSELKYEEAILAFEEVVQVDPNNMNATLGIADSYIGLNEEEKAVETLDKAIETIKQETGNEENVLVGSDEIYIRRADIQVDLGDLNGGIQILEEGYNLTQSVRLRDILDQYRDWLTEAQDTTNVDLSEEEKVVLNSLINFFEVKDFGNIKNILSDTIFSNFYQRIRGGSPYFYDGEKLLNTMGERGIIIFHYENVASTLVYYGDISQGKPMREGIIFESFEGIDNGSVTNGYSYYSGSWLEGKSNGQGEYVSFNQTGNSVVLASVKGSYSNGLEHGNMELVIQENNVAYTYHYSTQEGNIVVNDNVSLDETNQEYRVLSDDGNYEYYFPKGQVMRGWDMDLERIQNY